MNPTVIKKLDTLIDIEAAILAINSNSNAALQTSKDSIKKYKGAMHDASQLQLLVTWARATQDPFLHFHNENKLENVLSDLCAYAPGIAALRLCEGVKVGDKTVVRREALKGAIDKMRQTDEGDLSHIIKGRSIDMTCVSGADVQYLRPLFSAKSPEDVKDSEGMHTLMKELFLQVNQSDENLVPDSFVKACGIFASELFQNTQEHATRDHTGRPYDAHVEGLIISWSDMDQRLFGSDFQGHDRLKQFWESELAPSRNGSTKALRCLQLSFFDSGPGFASRATGLKTTELGLDLEREKLINCLKKNVTTKRQAGAGGGLPLVLTELKALGGLIRIRSGRHSIFNCFSHDGKEDIFNFDDWTNQSLGAVEGVVLSLIVPLRKSK
jgi:hypothetical protein